jgi:hypothetical protein
MKKVAENRYPHSAALFRFCKEALEYRYEGNVKVIDQDVGAILGYDPADCSHWKKGKKNIKTLKTIRTIAEYLKIDERLLIDVASGRMMIDEAIFEFKGYGEFHITPERLEVLKKQYYKKPDAWQISGGMENFERLFQIHREDLETLSSQVLDEATVKEAPVYVPELYRNQQGLHLKRDDDLEKPFYIRQTGKNETAETVFFHRGEEIKYFHRFLACKTLFKHLTATDDRFVSAFNMLPDTVYNVHANLFAGMILVPSHFLKREIRKIDQSLDLVDQLCKIFWVSKSLMNKRIQDHINGLK